MSRDFLIVPKEERVTGDKHWGMHKGRVSDNEDPDKRGRLQLILPTVTGDAVHPEWAEPMGFVMTPGKGYGSIDLPQKDDWVWVWFEDGDANYPRWVNGWWANDELPDELKGNYPFVRGLKTKEGHVVFIDDKDHVLRVRHKDGHAFNLTNDGAEVAHKDGHTLALTKDGVALTGKDKDVVIESGSGGVKVKSSAKVVVDAPKIELVENGSHNAVFHEVLDDLADAFQDLVQGLSGGTKGSPGAQILVDFMPLVPKFVAFITKLKAPATYRSQKVKIG